MQNVTVPASEPTVVVVREGKFTFEFRYNRPPAVLASMLLEARGLRSTKR